MSEKLTTADDVYAVLSDPAKLKEYKYMQKRDESKSGIDNEKFYLDLPYDEITAIVSGEMKKILERIPESERSKVTWEAVGSTSIKGMPGTMHPDVLLMFPEFPPSKPVLQALLDHGFYMSRAAPLDPQDVWWFYIFPDGILEEHKLTLHMTTVDNTAGKILRETRDMCRSEQWAFEDYKQAKIAANEAATSFLGYKMAKGKGSKLLEMIREKHGFQMPNLAKPN